MPFVDLNTITVTGTYLMFDQTPAAGFITFQAPASLQGLQDALGNQIIVPKIITATLDGSGHFTVALPATDDPDITPVGWTYNVTETITGASGQRPRVYNISVPVASPGGTLDLADVAPVDPLPGNAAYVLVGAFNALDSRVTALENNTSGGTGVTLDAFNALSDEVATLEASAPYEPLLPTTYQVQGSGTTTYNWDLSVHGSLDLTLNGPCTLTVSNWPSPTSPIETLRTIYIRNGIGNTLTWANNIQWEGGVPPSLDAFTIVTIGSLDSGAHIFGVYGAASSIIRSQWLDWRDYSPIPIFDATLITDLATHSNNVVDSAAFSSTAINGKSIVGPNIPANTTLTFTSVGHATISNNATSTGSSLRAIYGTDNTGSFNAFVTALDTASATGPVVGYIYGCALIMSAPASLGVTKGITLKGRGGLVSSQGPICVTSTEGTAFPTVLPPSALISGQVSPTVTCGITNGSNAITSSAQFNATTDMGIPVLGTGIPGGAHIIIITDSSHATISHNATATNASASLTFGRPFLNAYESTDFALEDIAVLNMTPLFKGIKVAAVSPSASVSKAGFRAARVTIADWAPAVVAGYGLHIGRQWYPRLDNVHFWGSDVQLMNCNDGSFSNNLIAIGCIFDRYGTVGIRNLSEGSTIIGPSFGTGDNGHVQAIDATYGVNHGPTIDGAWIRDAWACDLDDANGLNQGSWIRLNGGNQSGAFTVDGWRGVGGGTNSTLVQLVNENFNGLTIQNVSWNGGYLLDYNSLTCDNVRIIGCPATQGNTHAMFRNIPGGSPNTEPSGSPTTPTLTGSPYNWPSTNGTNQVYQNTDANPQLVYVIYNGGTLTLHKGGVTLLTITSGTFTLPVWLNPGENFLSTYTTNLPIFKVDVNRL